MTGREAVDGSRLLTPTVRQAADSERLAELTAQAVAEAIASASAARGRVALALCGGRTPVRAYELLAGLELPWEQVEIWLADERCVAADDPQANFRLLRERLVEAAGSKASAATVHAVQGELGPKAAADRYDALLRERLQGQLDLALLGIGEDGHVASLFPGQPQLRAPAARLAVGVEGAPKPPPERVTLSLSALRLARRCLLLASGAEKAAALAGALAHPSELYPASLLDRRRLEVLCEPQAARLLPPGVVGGA